jgi:hypothetical protein
MPKNARVRFPCTEGKPKTPGHFFLSRLCTSEELHCSQDMCVPECVCMGTHTRTCTRLWLLEVGRGDVERTGGSGSACAAQRPALPGWPGAWPSPGGSVAVENSLIVLDARRPPPAAGGLQIHSHRLRGCGAAPRAPAARPAPPARHLSSERHCKWPRLASWTTPKGTRGLGLARGKQGGFIPVLFGDDLEQNSQGLGGGGGGGIFGRRAPLEAFPPLGEA